MQISLINEENIEKLVKYCRKEISISKNLFVVSSNIVESFQQLNLVRNFYFNNAIKVWGTFNEEGNIENLLVVRLADAIETLSSIEILIMSLDQVFIKEVIQEIEDYFSDTDYCKIKIRVNSTTFTEESIKILHDNNFNLEAEYDSSSGSNQIYCYYFKEQFGK